MENAIDYTKIEKHAKIRKKVSNTITYILLAVWALIVLFPFYWMILTSVKSYSAYTSEYVPKFFTLSPTLQNYVEAFTAVPLGRYFLNTTIFTIVTTAIMLVSIIRRRKLPCPFIFTITHLLSDGISESTVTSLLNIGILFL